MSSSTISPSRIYGGNGTRPTRLQDFERLAHRLGPRGPHAAVELGQQPQRDRLPHVPGKNDDRFAGLELAARLAEDLPDAVLVGAIETARSSEPRFDRGGRRAARE